PHRAGAGLGPLGDRERCCRDRGSRVVLRGRRNVCFHRAESFRGHPEEENHQHRGGSRHARSHQLDFVPPSACPWIKEVLSWVSSASRIAIGGGSLWQRRRKILEWAAGRTSSAGKPCWPGSDDALR